MPKKIENKDLFASDLFQSQKKSVAELTKLIELLKEEMKDLLKVQGEIIKTADKSSVEGLNKRKKAIDEVNTVEKEMIRLDKQKESLQAKLQLAESSQAKAVERTRQALNKKRKAVRDQIKAETTLTGAYQKQSKRLNELRLRLKNIIIEEGKSSKETRRLAREVTLLDGKLKAADRAAGQFQRNVGNYPDTIGRATTVLRQFGLTIGAIGLTRKFFNEIKDFEQGLIGVGKVADISGQELKDFGASVIETSNRLKSISTEKLLELSTAAGQLGVKGEANILKFAETLARLEKATDVIGEEGARSIARILNITNEGVDTVDRFGAAIVALGNDFAATESEIIKASTEVARATTVFGVSSQQAAAFGAVLTSLGVQSEAGGTAIGKTFRAINKSILAGGKQLQELERITQLTGKQLRETFATDATKVFNLFIKGLNRTQKEGEDLTSTLESFGLSNERLLKVIPVLVGRQDELTRAMDLSSDAYEKNTALIVESDKAMDSVQGALDFVINRFSNLFTEVATGNGVLEGLKNLLNFVGNNLGSILKVVKAVVIGWISYRLALRLVNRETNKFKRLGIISLFRSMIKTMALMTKGTRGLALGFRRIRKAIKSIPLVAWISGITTAISLLIDFIGGIDDSADALDAEARALEESNKQLTERQRLLAQFAGEEKSIAQQIKGITELTDKQVKNLLAQAKNQLQTVDDIGNEAILSAAKTLETLDNNAKSKQIINEKIIDQQKRLNQALEEGDIEQSLRIKEEIKQNDILLLSIDDINEIRKVSNKRISEEEEIRTELTQSQIKSIEEELKRRKLLIKSSATASSSSKKELTELQKLQKALSELNTLRANELILRGETEKFIDITAEARALDERIKLIREKLKFDQKANEGLEEEIALINALIDAEQKRSTGIDTGRIQSLKTEIDLLDQQLNVLEDIIDAEEETESQLKEFDTLQLKRIDASKELQRLSFGRLDPAKTERDLIRDSARIRLKFIDDEKESLRNKIQLDKFNEELQLKLLKLLLEEKQLRQDIRDVRFDEEQERISNAALDLQIKFNEEILNGTLETNEEIVEAETQLQIKLLRLRIAGLKNQRTQFDETSEEYKELTLEILQAANEIGDLQDMIVDNLNKTADEEAQILRDRLNALQEFARKAVEIANAKTDKEIEAINKELSANQKNQSKLEKLAAEGNLKAEQSISAEIKREAELERQKSALEKKKIRRKMIIEGLDLLSAKIDNGDTDAVTSVINDMTRLLGALALLPGFYKGTDTTVEKALGKSPLNTKKDAYVIRVDGKEKIMNPEQSARTGNATTEEITKAYEMSQMGAFDQNVFIRPQIEALQAPFQDQKQLLNKLDQVTQAIKDKPTLADLKLDDLMEYFTKTIEINGDLHKTHYKLK